MSCKSHIHSGCSALSHRARGRSCSSPAKGTSCVCTHRGLCWCPRPPSPAGGDVHVRDSSWSMAGGVVCRGYRALHVSPWKEIKKEREKEERKREKLAWTVMTLRTPLRSGKGLSQESFRLPSEAGLCFTNKYYPGKGIEPGIFKVLVSSLNCQTQNLIFPPPRPAFCFLYLFSPFAVVHSCIEKSNSWYTNQVSG